MLFLTTAEEKLEHLTVFLGGEPKVLSKRCQWQLHSKTMSNPAVFFFKLDITRTSQQRKCASGTLAYKKISNMTYY